jgi:hypothetical protein
VLEVTTLRKVTRAVAEAMSPFQYPAQVAQVLTWPRQASDEGGSRRVVLSVGRSRRCDAADSRCAEVQRSRGGDAVGV